MQITVKNPVAMRLPTYYEQWCSDYKFVTDWDMIEGLF